MMTKQQIKLLAFIDSTIRATGGSPSYEEMRVHLDLKSKSGVARLVEALAERRMIVRLPRRARAICLPHNVGADNLGAAEAFLKIRTAIAAHRNVKLSAAETIRQIDRVCDTVMSQP